MFRHKQVFFKRGGGYLAPAKIKTRTHSGSRRLNLTALWFVFCSSPQFPTFQSMSWNSLPIMLRSSPTTRMLKMIRFSVHEHSKISLSERLLALKPEPESRENKSKTDLKIKLRFRIDLKSCFRWFFDRCCGRVGSPTGAKVNLKSLRKPDTMLAPFFHQYLFDVDSQTGHSDLINH